MKCAICQSGVTVEGYTTIVLEKDHTTLVFKKVPAEICENCGEEYISEEVNKALLPCPGRIEAWSGPGDAEFRCMKPPLRVPISPLKLAF